MKHWKKGDIILWYGAAADIRKGWALCNGSNGTPDLRGVSVVGAGGSFAVGDKGGASSHTHSFSAGSHTHPIGPAPPDLNLQSGSDRRLVGTLISGTTGDESTRSPYHALCFIMKL